MARTLTLKRTAHLLGNIAVKAVVIIDGKEAGEMRNGEEKSFEISEGEVLLVISARSGRITPGKLKIPSGTGDLSLRFDTQATGMASQKWFFPGVDGDLLWFQSRSEINNPIERYEKNEKEK